MYDAAGNRLGWGRVGMDGVIELFDAGGNRIGLVRQSFAGNGDARGYEFDENLHPRDDAGKWTDTGGGAGGQRQWIDAKGVSVTDGAQLDRIKRLAIPPAWTDVKVAADPMAHLQAVGRDAKGRTQARYSGAFTTMRAVAKFKRVEKLAKGYPRLVAGAAADMAKGNEAATVASLILSTSMRVGSDGDTLASVKAYGATTLEARHVSVSGNVVSFDFMGKKGVPWQGGIENGGLATAMRRQLGGKSGTDRVFTVSAKDVNQYFKRYGKFSAKDIRTLHGTALAKQALAKEPEPTTKTAARSLVKRVSDFVAMRLHNTGAVAKSAYINPVVWAPLEAKFGMKVLKATA